MTRRHAARYLRSMLIVKTLISHVNRIFFAALIAAGALAYASPTSAAPVTFDFSGTVTQLSTDPDDPFNGTVGFGTAFFGSYVFESTAPDAIAGAGSGSYTSPAGSPYGLSVTIGVSNKAATSDFLNIGVVNGATDFYTVLACEGGSGCPNLLIELLFEDLAGLMLSSDALPLDTLALGSAFGTLTVRGNAGGNQVEVLGVITSLACVSGCVAPPDPNPGPDPNPAPIPEPATLVLCMTGLAGGLWTRARKRTIS